MSGMSLCKFVCFLLLFVGRRHELTVHWHHFVVWSVFSTVMPYFASSCYVSDVKVNEGAVQVNLKA